jgi:hypothetical protein
MSQAPWGPPPQKKDKLHDPLAFSSPPFPPKPITPNTGKSSISTDKIGTTRVGHIHWWKTVAIKDGWYYKQCRCGLRKANKHMYSPGYSPKDETWVRTGKWFDPSTIKAPLGPGAGATMKAPEAPIDMRIT